MPEQARADFDKEMGKVKASLSTLPRPAPLEDVEKLAREAKAAASRATLLVQSAADPDIADGIVEDEGWEGEADDAGEDWVRDAKKALGVGTDEEGGGDGVGGGGGGDIGGGGGNGGGGGSKEGVGDNKNRDTADADRDTAGDPKGEGDGEDESGAGGDVVAAAADDDGVARLVESILSEYYAPCAAEVTLKGKGEDTLRSCRAAADKEWGRAEETRPELKGKKSEALDPAVEEKEAECIER